MKKLLFLLAAVALCACSQPQATVTVANPGATTYSNQTVEVAWETLTAKLTGLTAENVVVTDAQGVQIPSQVIYQGGEAPVSLIFQVTLAGGQSADYGVALGERKTYKAETFGRFVPERKDDYAWENNVVAYRAYGPALSAEMISGGFDYWSKSTPELVIDAWYERDLSGKGSYHVDAGEGSDCYKVGPTVGMGASAPVFDGKLYCTSNYASWRTLDNGPVRTSVELTYIPFAVGEKGPRVSLVKVISLDANTHLNRITDRYDGDFENLTIAAGVVIHDDAELATGDNYSALYEPASDSHTPTGDGSIGGAVIALGSQGATVDGTMARLVQVKAGEPMTYYAGGATSKREMTDAAKWFSYVATTAAELGAPLQVSVK